MQAMEEVASGIITMDYAGDLWKRHRRTLTPAFRTQNMKYVFDVTLEKGQRLVDNVKDGRDFNMHHEFSEHAFDVLLKGTMGYDISRASHENFYAHFLTLSRGMSRRMKYPKELWFALISGTDKKRYRDATTAVNDLVDSIVAERFKGAAVAPGSDLLSLMIDARDDNGQGFTLHEIRQELILFMLAGHETSANGAIWHDARGDAHWLQRNVVGVLSVGQTP